MSEQEQVAGESASLFPFHVLSSLIDCLLWQTFRLGIVDSSEIPPTFAVPPSQFVGVIAGGDAAIRQAQEGAEDDPAAGMTDLMVLNLDPESDSVIGIAASGRTPYVLGALEYAKSMGCLTIGVVCVVPSVIGESGHADIMISPLPGPEVVTGSTRLKAGTATKLVLNMLSTGTMIRVGKTCGNMVRHPTIETSMNKCRD